MKGTAKRTEGESTPQEKTKEYYENRPSEAWFPSYGLMKMKENAQGLPA
jgi:hypothetical protein